MKKINSRGIELIKKYEGLRLEAYLCPSRVWTIGYGHTQGVRQGDKISELQADMFLKRDLAAFERVVSDAVLVPITDNMFSALVSFTYNVGRHNLKRSTLLKELNKGNYADAGLQFGVWNRSKGKILLGLVKRRLDEMALFLDATE